MSSNLQGTEIAIVAISGRFPGAASTTELWQNLAGGVESISFFSDEELRSEGISEEVISNPAYVKARGIIRDAEWFDASFFGLAPRQAELMDPQHRLFMECVWEALESAGYDPQRYDGSIGVYAGTTMSSYLVQNLSNRESAGSVGSFEVLLANDKDYLTTGVSYRLNLKGPSVAVQTSCSTSLVAIHIACQSLLNGECDMALAGGVSIVFPQKAGYVYREGGTRAPDGHCRAFDAKAGGMVSGSGVGVVLLKKLESALRDGDHIRAIIRGSAVNNDGNLKVGFTAPSVEGQSAVIAEAQSIAGVDPESITYVETHGTGTRLGDPCEIRALTQAFRAGTAKRGFCAIGSLKTNIGHLDVAAGVSGVIKTVLALENRRIPASLHFQHPNPEIDLEGSPFFVNDTLTEWPEGLTPRRAGVSSFGIGGTNAHIVLEEAPRFEPSASGRSKHVIVLSAKSPAALDRATSNLADHLRANPEACLADVAYTLQVGRRAFTHRRALVCSGTDDAVALLDQSNGRRLAGVRHDGSDPMVVFMFTGQGAQRPNMGLGLYNDEPEFRRHLDDCCDLFRTHLGLDLRDSLFPRAGREDEAAHRLEQTQITQPAMFAFEYALARLWIGWGIRPGAMIGHSIGEITAACLAGVFTLEDAVAVVANRGRLMGAMPAGDMLSVPLPESALQALLGDALSVAAINAPGSCVVSGPKAAIDVLEATLQQQNCTSVRLRTSHAFHSAMMEPVVEPFTDHVQRRRLHAPQIPFISNVTGDWITPSDATDPSYWGRHLRQTVRFAQGVERLLAEPDRILVEVGPGTTLRSFAAAHPAKHDRTVVLSSLPPARERHSDSEHILQTLGQLWMHGCQPDWSALYGDEVRRRVLLPTYPFERQRYWISADSERPEVRQAPRRDVTDWLFEPTWKRSTLPKGAPIEKAAWLLFVDDSGLGTHLVEMLTEQGSEAICVFVGSGFSRTSAHEFTIDPGRPQDYVSLVGELLRSGGVPSRLVHLWSVSTETPYETNPTVFAQRQERGFYSLLYLVQALSGSEVLMPLQLSVVTSQAQDVTGEELLCPDKATVLSAALAIGTEFPHIQCRSVDVSMARAEDAALQAENLLTELRSNAADLVVAWRGRYRWLQSFEPLPLASTPEPPKRLREGGTYLITGGMGGIGLSLAGYLARTVRANLVLVGRAELPPRERWQDIADHSSMDDPLNRKIRGIQSMERSGAHVLVCRADVSDKHQMSAALASARNRFGPIHGVIHAAGIPGGGVLLRQTPETVERVFAAKVQGTLVLDELFRDEPLDFFLLCSSQTAFLGLPGRSEYAAANRFIDTFARQRARSGDGVITTINWDTWQDVGMAVQSKRKDDGTHEEVRPEIGLTTDQGVDVFARILQSGATQVLVAVLGVDVPAARSDGSRRGVQNDQASATAARPSTLSSHPRPALETEYEAPRDDRERTLAGIWQEVLGIETIGIKDNFFELGGDSVIALQIVAKANQAGLRLTPRHVLERQNIAELAATVGTTRRIEPDQGIVTGVVPLTPIQRWFFERDSPEPHHFNQSVLLEELQPVDQSLFQQSIRCLLEHHDALRLRYKRDTTGWNQFIAAPDDLVAIEQIDLSSVVRAEQRSAIEAAAAQLQRSLNLSDGPLIRVAHFNLGPEQHGRWLVVVHHLAIDVVSWRFLLEDLLTAYHALSQGRPVSLPPKTVSLKQWSERLTEHAQSPVVLQEMDYWLSVTDRAAARLPVDFPQGENTYGSVEELSSSLTTAETHALMHQSRAAYGSQLDELLLTATVQAFSRWTGQSTLLLDLEGHGREEFIEGIDASRTLGWFTTIYPVALRLAPGTAPHDATKQIAEQLRAVPHRGMNYGLLRYLAESSRSGGRLDRAPQPEVGFLYLGAVDQRGAQSSLLGAAEESAGPGQSARNVRPHLLELVVKVESERLRLSWTFSRTVHNRETIQTLNEYVLESLRALIDSSGRSQADTPSVRFPLARLDQPTLARLMEDTGEVEDLYPLSPMQHGMLFHSLYSSDASVYCLKVGRWFHGELNVSALQQAWQSVVDRHSVLRTTFHWEDLEHPLQAVHREVALAWQEEDWRGLPDVEQQRRLDSFIESDSARGFDLRRPPLMRFCLIRTAEDVHYFHWSFHHGLLDGWCINLVVKEVLDFYQAYCDRRQLQLKSPRPYRDYIAWLGRQDPLRAEVFWKDVLKGFVRPTMLASRPATGASHAGTQRFEHQTEEFSESDSDALVELARRHKLTVSTVFQGIWALLVSQRCSEPDIVFGSVVSGQSAEIEEMAAMVGLFMNTLPMRATVDPRAELFAWLREFQSRHAMLREYEYTPLVDIHRWSEVTPGSPLFDCIVSFRNQPVHASLQQSLATLNIRSSAFSNPSHYPLTVEGRFQRTLWFRLVYDCSRFEPTTIQEIRRQFAIYLSSVIHETDSTLAAGAFLERAQRLFLDEQEARLDGLSKSRLRMAVRKRGG